jgi:motility quorum-sensing regulator/GCU-specific mRNA interferase toxin
MLEKRKPHYDLALIQTLARAGQLTVTRRVRAYLDAHGWDVRYVAKCLASLTRADLHKSQSHRDRSGVWLDIYRPTFDGRPLYVKFMLDDDLVWVLSFCIDGEEH